MPGSAGERRDRGRRRARAWCTPTWWAPGRPRRGPAAARALALIGAPPPAYLVGDGPLRGALTRLIRARGLEAVVHLPGWSYEPARDIAQATVHVVPSREESWSQSAVLALGLGVPVVGTAVDGLARTLGEGRGVLVPPEDPRALAGALSRVLAGERPDPALGRACARQFTPAQRPRYRPAPTASCSPAAPEPGKPSAPWP